MKVIDAFWEKRNLGIDVLEVEIENGDSILKVDERLKNLKADYISVKIPSSMPEFMEVVQQNGFFFREDLIHVRHDLSEITRTAMQQRLYEKMSYRVMTEEDIIILYNEIHKGMFSTDRFSLDEKFTPEQCANRYANWIDDLRAKGAIPYVLMYKEEPSGFIIVISDDNKTYQSVLGGVYEKYRKGGLGAVQMEQEIVKKLGAKYLETTVSSNNVGQLKALIVNGYVPISINHVFAKHLV